MSHASSLTNGSSRTAAAVCASGFAVADNQRSGIAADAVHTRSGIRRSRSSPSPQFSSFVGNSGWPSMGTPAVNVLMFSVCVLLSVEAGKTNCSVNQCCVINSSNTYSWPHEVVLKCSGIQNIPAIYETIQKLTLDGTEIKEILLTDMKNLDVLDSRTFKNLNGLRTLTISKVNFLKGLSSDVFGGFSKSLLVLSVTKTNLKTMPDLSGLGISTAMHSIEFEGNSLHTLRKNGIKTRAESLILEYNKIHVIENWAFNGSEVAKLSLKGNDLDQLSDHSFDGIVNLLKLDLSDTKIKILPTSGLMNIEILSIKNTYSLTSIPSIYSLDNLKEAHLTYPFHCCSFQFPSKHGNSRDTFQEVNIQHSTSKCEQMKKNVQFNQTSRNFVKDPIVEDDNGEEEFFHNSAITTNTMDIICGNLTPQITKVTVKCWPQPNALNPCENIMGFDWLRICVWMVGITALLANMVVLLVLFCKRSHTSVSRFLMSNLAFADFCTAIYLLLLAYEDKESNETYFNYAYTWQNGIGCKIGGFLTVFSSQLSVFALCLLTIERWYSIRRALYNTKMTFTITFRMMTIGWVYSIAMASLPLLGISSYSTTSICLPMDTVHPSGLCYVFTLLAFAAVAFMLMSFCYVQIYTSLSYDTRHAAKGEVSVVRKILILVGTNFACTAPVIFFGFTALLGYPLIDVTKCKILLVFVYPINSCANPFLYTILTAKFRRDVVSTFTKFGLCTGSEKEYKVIYSTKNNSQHVNTAHYRNTVSTSQHS